MKIAGPKIYIVLNIYTNIRATIGLCYQYISTTHSFYPLLLCNNFNWISSYRIIPTSKSLQQLQSRRWRLPWPPKASLSFLSEKKDIFFQKKLDITYDCKDWSSIFLLLGKVPSHFGFGYLFSLRRKLLIFFRFDFLLLLLQPKVLNSSDQYYLNEWNQLADNEPDVDHLGGRRGG